MYNMHFLNISNVINGLSRGLEIINRVIPLFDQARPMISNAKGIIKTINGKRTNNLKIIDIKENKKNTFSNYTNPVFFQ